MISRCSAYLLLAVLAALNAYLDLLHVRATLHVAKGRTPPPSHYTFIDDDYAPRLPLPSARRAVKLTFEDSARYALYAPEANAEWLSTATVGDGNVHLGPAARFFVVGVTHQLHCMRAYRQALAQDAPVRPHTHQGGHLAHCLNFLRMSTLCAADVALEPPDALAREHGRGGAGGVHECVDWPAFYDEMKANYEGWTAYQESDV
ncbi:uncharacterized protein TRAVEDRAFT_134403 [Trametes versicolor FP-101664 SS1]|uniref:uncharacterized protein n=1 Tax=Trametes versicolor (strain FP-101664) TaxID=717944 RepID=UPI0004623A27|nr:uncharacterized protein TRAVEDRAFT_134403 [Trametes versicolor FP-101664 SS1]EIW52653.1 hypothetical protein TRAVEDRAFT_134403 [Trametes versicolor FP-101664 SS1]